MSLLGDNKLVHALHSVNELSPMLHQMVDELQAMRLTLVETNTELRAMKDELDAVKSSMGTAASQVQGAADQMGTLAAGLMTD